MPDKTTETTASLPQPLVPIDPLSDGHIHTSLCNHAIGKMEDYVQSALNKGLHKIIFLEHMEEGQHYFRTTWLSEKDFDIYFEEGQRLQAKYSGRISIGLGVEVGYNPQFPEQLLKRLAKRKWDRIGISYHYHNFLDNEEHLNLVSKNDSRVQKLDLETSIRIEKCYYNTLIEAVNYLPGTVLCHLDAVLRHHPQKKSMQMQWEHIDKLLDCIKRKKMALEINTSGMAIRNEFFPCQEIVFRARARGIPLVAGSHAHRPEDVGNHFNLLESYCTR